MNTKSRASADAAFTVASLRTLATAFVIYSSTYGKGLPPDLNFLKNPAAGARPDCGTSGAGH